MPNRLKLNRNAATTRFKMTEANTQAEFYHHAKLNGLCVELEFNTPVGRLDAIVWNTDRSMILAGIEVKRDGRSIDENNKQMRKYATLGMPMFWLNKFSAAEGLVKHLIENLNHNYGLTREQLSKMPKVTPSMRKRWVRLNY